MLRPRRLSHDRRFRRGHALWAFLLVLALASVVLVTVLVLLAGAVCGTLAGGSDAYTGKTAGSQDVWTPPEQKSVSKEKQYIWLLPDNGIAVAHSGE
jgi:hypothetical protein